MCDLPVPALRGDLPLSRPLYGRLLGGWMEQVPA